MPSETTIPAESSSPLAQAAVAAAAAIAAQERALTTATVSSTKPKNDEDSANLKPRACNDADKDSPRGLELPHLGPDQCNLVHIYHKVYELELQSQAHPHMGQAI